MSGLLEQGGISHRAWTYFHNRPVIGLRRLHGSGESGISGFCPDDSGPSLRTRSI